MESSKALLTLISKHIKEYNERQIKNYKNSKTLTYTTDVPAGSVVKWTSSNEKVVTVDENGNVYAAGTGDATVTCTVTDANGKTIAEASCDFKVSYTILQWIIIIVLFGWLWY